MQTASGTLYLVATPIGNLEDITFRAVRLLKETPWIYCEDTRRTSVLLKHFEIEKKLESFHDHSSPHVISNIVQKLKEGADVVYVTDGGMPVVSDPGFVLVRAAVENKLAVSVIPGPSAAVMLFAASSLPSPKFFFHGFFPRTKGEIERVMGWVREMPVVHLFYEAPSRTVASLEVLQRNFPAAQVVVGRELTKIHEEILRGTAQEVYEDLSRREKVRGECVIGILLEESKRKTFRASQEEASSEASGLDFEGNPESQPSEELSPAQQEEITALVKSGVSSKDAARLLSKKFRVSRRVIYEFIIHRLT